MATRKHQRARADLADSLATSSATLRDIALRLSIIIPSLGDHLALELTLLSVLENRPAECEIIVCDRSRYTDPYKLDGEVRFVPVEGDTSVAGCFNAALASARGTVVHCLAPGMTIEEGWSDEAVDRIENNLSLGALVPRCRDRSGDRQLLGIGCGRGGGRQPLRTQRAVRRAVVWGPVAAAGFYRRAALQLVGGWDRTFVTYADLELAARLAKSGFACDLVTATVDGRHWDDLMHGSSYRRAYEAEQFYQRYRRQGFSAWQHHVSIGMRWCRMVVRPWALLTDACGVVAGRWTRPNSERPNNRSRTEEGIDQNSERSAGDSRVIEIDEHRERRSRLRRSSESRRRSA